MNDQTLSLSVTITPGDIPADGSLTAVDILAYKSGLPKSRVKDAMIKGAVTLSKTPEKENKKARKRKGKTKRCRKAKTSLQIGDTLELHYDPRLLAIKPDAPGLIADEKDYSVWFKPAGLLSQGTVYGDHCAMLRLVETTMGRPTYLVHRLDREAEGIMIIAHSSSAAAALSKCFQQSQIEKKYQIEVLGCLPEAGSFTDPIDGKQAETHFKRIKSDTENNCSQAEVTIIQGRKHQIRRHFYKAGFPVMGDPLYGRGNKDPRGLQLRAYHLRFYCPIRKQEKVFQLAPNQLAPGLVATTQTNSDHQRKQ